MENTKSLGLADALLYSLNEHNLKATSKIFSCPICLNLLLFVVIQ